MVDLPDETKKRFVAVLNKKIEPGKLMNALGHTTAGLAARLGVDETCMLQYEDADGGVHPDQSHYPFIVLRADNSNKIRAIRNEAVVRDIPFTDFTSTMTIGTSAEQVEATKQTKEANLEYFAICLFGDTEQLREFTGKLSLYR